MTAVKVMPVNLAMHMGLNRHASVDQLMGMPKLQPSRALTRPNIYDSLRSRPVRSLSIPTSPVNSSSPSGTPNQKKHVVFADEKGQALATVRIFNPEPDEEEPSSPGRINAEPSVQNKKLRLRLGFAEPSADLPLFTESLRKTFVRLESCSLVNGSLFGKVRVCNLSPEKTVHVRVTYDSWKSHQDILCSHIPQKNGKSETELFFFSIRVLSSPNVQDRVEFRVSFRPGSGNIIFWDNNGGQNYKILVEEENSEDVSSVDKKLLMPQSFKRSQSFPMRIDPPLSRSTSFSSCYNSMNMRKTLIRQENVMPKGYSSSDSVNADR